MHVLSTGCQWRSIAKDLPPRSTVHDYFDLWSWDGTLDRVHHALYVRCREQAEREASPSAAIIDSLSVKSAEKGGGDRPAGYDVGKKVKGKKRHMLVDTKGYVIPNEVPGRTLSIEFCSWLRNLARRGVSRVIDLRDLGFLDQRRNL